MGLFKKLMDVFQNEKEKVKDNINDVNVELLMLSDNLEQLSLIEKLFDSDINAVDTTKLKSILNSLNVNVISDDELRSFDEVKKIIKYLYDPQLPNVGIKKAKLAFINDFKNKIINISREVNNKIEQLRGLLFSYREISEKIDYYLTIVSSDGFDMKMSIDELNKFFDFLESTTISKSLILDIVSEITINKLKNEEKLSEQKSSDSLPEFDKIEEEIDKNVEKIIGVKKQDEDVNGIDLSLLTEEERELLLKFEKLLSENSVENVEYLFDLVKDEFGDFNIDERQEYYFSEGNLEWDMIFADYYSNLLPNINTHKDEVLSIVKYVIDSDDKIKKSTLVEKDELQKQIKDFRGNSNLARDMLDNFYSNTSEYLYGMSEVDVQIVNDLISEIGVLLKDTFVKVDNNNINSNELKIVNLHLIKLMAKLQEITSKKEELNNDTSKKSYKLETTKTLILLLKDGVGNFVPVKEVENETHKDISDVMNDELQKSIVMMSERGMSDNKKKFGSSHVDKKSGTGSDVLLKDCFGFDVDRIRFGNHGRTGYVIVPVHEDNRKKLISVYGNNIFNQNYNSIILVVASICCSAGHSEYDMFKDLIGENLSYVSYVLNLFKNPNASIEEMMGIIEDSAKECKKISSGYGRGGK